MKRFNFINGCSKFVVGSMLGFGMLFSAVHAESPSASKPVASAVSQAPKSSDQAKAAPQNTVVASTDAKSQNAPAAQQSVAQQQAPVSQAPAAQGQAAPQQNQSLQQPAVQNAPADGSQQGDIFFGAPDPGSQQAPITPGESH